MDDTGGWEGSEGGATAATGATGATGAIGDIYGTGEEGTGLEGARGNERTGEGADEGTAGEDGGTVGVDDTKRLYITTIIMMNSAIRTPMAMRSFQYFCKNVCDFVGSSSFFLVAISF
jgi:hypothetical protein